MTSFISSTRQFRSRTLSSRTANRIVLTIILALVALVTFGAPLLAQTSSATYSCFPSCSETDARFLTIAGGGYHTLKNTTIIMKVAAPGVATAFDIAFFDGETGGMWDQGMRRLKYYLYADPTGTGVGTTRVAEFMADSMLDNAWRTFTVTNVAAARTPNGNYSYKLVVSTIADNTGSTSDNSGSGSSNSGSSSSNGRDNDDEDGIGSYWSSFKVRTSGTLALKPQAFTVCATANTDLDLAVIYPAGLSHLDSTTYDGTWKFFLDVPTASSSFSVWDGDMDFGSYDCSANDVDDLNTPNNVLPAWASPETTILEGVGVGSPCYGTSGYATGAPPDDNRYPVYRRSPAVNYDVVTPQGHVFTNSNPSGGKEWEEFKLSTAPLDRNLADAHVDSIPGGIYELRVNGMDLGNLNAWRFNSDAVGIDELGVPVEPIRPYAIAGNVNLGTTSTITSTATSTTTIRRRRNAVTGSSADTTSTAVTALPGRIANAVVTLTGDLNGDGLVDITLTTVTDADGNYSFPDLEAGTYSISIAYSSLPAGSIGTADFDGSSTLNQATVTLSGTTSPTNVDFSYRISASGTSTGGTRTQGYWKTHASEWTCTSIRIGCATYTRERAIEIMNMSVRGDMTYAMFYQLVAAKLNVAGGSRSTCILQTIADAEAWMCANPLGSNVASTSSAWRNGADDLHDALDEYNNGLLCAPHVN